MNNQATVSMIPLPESEIDGFTDYVTDHINHFNAVPCEYESTSGKVYGMIDTWNIALKLGLTNLIK